MKIDLDRLVLTVCRHDGQWVVEEGGAFFAHASDKEVAKAFANKRARQVQEGGRACQVRVSGEHGFYAG